MGHSDEMAHRAACALALCAVHGRITCDIGPPVPTSTIPPAAKLAGFADCTANFDFSQPHYVTLSNWFDCGGRNPNVLWHKGSARVNFANPCSTHQKVDPVTGQKVMNFHWDTSYGNRGNGTQAAVGDLGSASEDLAVLRHNRDLGVTGMTVRLPPAKEEKILPILDRWAKLIPQVSG